jgi:tetratricopeptide (TPR) repeat protein
VLIELCGFCFGAILLSFGLLCGQTPARPQAEVDRPVPPHPSSSNGPELPLVEIQSLVDSGKLSDAEGAVRRYLDIHKSSADAHYLLGYILFKEDNPKPSLAEYTEGARYRAPSALDLEVIGCDYFLMEDYAAADKWLTKSLELDRKNALALYFLGRTKYNQKHFEEALHLFTECLVLDPKNAKAEENLGLSYERLGRTEEAIKAYRTAIALDGASIPRNPGPYLDAGTLLTAHERPTEALPYLVQAVQIASSDSRAHRELGKAYLLLNQLEDAQTQLEKAVELDPQSGPTHFLLGQVYRKRGLLEKARLENDRYIALTGGHSSPDDPLAEARSLLNLSKLSDAEQVVRQYLEIHKNSADAHYLLGYILFKEHNPKSSLAEYTEGAKYRKPSAYDLEAVGGDYVLLHDYADADKWFSKSVEWDPGNLQALYYLGRAKYNENRFEEAVSIFIQCLKLDPKSVKAEDNLGLSYEGLGRVEDAMAAYRTAISWEMRESTNNSGPYIDLGTLLVNNGRSSEAIPYLTKALQISPEDIRAHRELGKAYLHLNQLEKAQAELEKSVQLAPQSAPAHFILAQVYRKRGLLDKARLETERYSALAGAHSSDDESQ